MKLLQKLLWYFSTGIIAAIVYCFGGYELTIVALLGGLLAELSYYTTKERNKRNV